MPAKISGFAHLTYRSHPWGAPTAFVAARAANRNSNNNRGFRVVLSAHISSVIKIAEACRPRFTARSDDRKNGAGASGPHAERRAYTKRECSLTSGPEHSHLIAFLSSFTCRSGPCPRRFVATNITLQHYGTVKTLFAPMGYSYNALTAFLSNSPAACPARSPCG
jgi:hypothetical protein